MADRTDYINIVLRLRDEFAGNLRRSRQELTGFREEVEKTERSASANMKRLDSSTEDTTRRFRDLKAAGVDMSGTLGQKILDADQKVKKLNERLDEQREKFRGMKEGEEGYESLDKAITKNVTRLQSAQHEQAKLNNLLRNNFERSNQIERQQLRVEEAAKRVATLRASTLSSDNKILDAEKELNALARELVRLRSDDGKIHHETLDRMAREAQLDQLRVHQEREIVDIRKRGEALASKIGSTEDVNGVVRMRRELNAMVDVLRRLGKTQEEVNEIRDEFTAREMVAGEKRASEEIKRINDARTKEVARLEKELEAEIDAIRKDREIKDRESQQRAIEQARTRTNVVIAETERERAADIKAIKDKDDARRRYAQTDKAYQRSLEDAARSRLNLERALEQKADKRKVVEPLRIQAGRAEAEALKIREELEAIMGEVDVKVELKGVTEAIAELVALRAAERSLTSSGGGGRGGLIGFAKGVGDAFNESSNNIAAFDNFIRGLLTLGIAVFMNQIIVAAVALGGALMALASSAMYAGGALGGGLTAGIAQALPMLGILFAAVARVKAVTDALKQAQLLQQQQSYQGAKQDKKVADTTDQVTNAQEQLADAHRRVEKAQKDLTLAREEARQKLQELILAERGQSLSAEEAQDALRKALSTGDVSGIARARLNVDETRYTLRKTRHEISTRRDEGIEGSPEVTRAAEQLKDAERAAKQAERGIDRAKRGADIAAADVTAASGKLDFLLSRLSPAEKRLYEGLKRLQDDWRKVSQNFTEPLISSFTYGVNRIDELLHNNRLIGAARSLSSAMGKSFTRIFDAFTDNKTIGFFTKMMKEAERNLRPLTNIIINIGKAFEGVATAASPALREIVDMVDEWVASFAKFTGSAEGQKAMTDFFKLGVVNLREWLRLFGAVGRLFWAIASPGGGADAGLGLIERMTSLIDGLTAKINAHPAGMQRFFRLMRDAFEALLPILSSIADEIDQTFTEEGVSHLRSFVDFMTKILIPAVGDFIRTIGKVASVLGWLAGNPFFAAIGKFIIEWVLIGGLMMKVGTLFSPLFSILGKLGTAFGLVGAEAGAAAGVGRWSRLRGVIASVTSAVGGLISKIPGLRGLGGAIGGIGGAGGRAPYQYPGSGGAPGPAVGGGGIAGALRSLGGFGVAAAGRGGVGGTLLKDLTGGLGGGMVAGIARASIWGDVAQGMVRGVVEGIKKKSASAGAAEALHAMTFGALDFRTKDYDKIDKSIGEDIDHIQALAEQKAHAKKLGIQIDVDLRPGAKQKVNAELNSLMDSLDRTVGHVKTKTQSWAGYFDSMKTDIGFAVKRINRDVQTGALTQDEAEQAMAATYGTAANSIMSSMQKLHQVTAEGIKQYDAMLRKSLAAYGMTKPDIDQEIEIRNYAARHHGDRGTGAATLATGGWVGEAGERGRDAVHTVLGRGEAVLNYAHQKYLEPAVNWFYGHSLGDTFKRVRGWHAGGHEQPGFAAGGQLGGVHAGIRNAAEKVLAKFPQLSVTSTTGGGHAANSYHYRGMAVDIGGPTDVMNRAAAWIKSVMGAKLTEAIHAPNLSIKSGKAVPSSFWGAETWGNHFNHIHLAVAGALGALKGIAGGAGELVKRIVLGDKAIVGGGTMGLLGTGVLSGVRAGAQKVLDRAREKINADSAGGGDTSSQPAKPYHGPLNKIFAKHFAGEGGTQLTPGQVAKLAASVGLPGTTFAQIAHGESNYYPGVQQRDPGDGNVGYGLWQMTPHAWGKGSAAYDYMMKLGGIPAMFNPYKNALMAKFLYDAAGHSISPWYGTKYVTSSRQGHGAMARGGFAGIFDEGGEIPGPLGSAWTAIVHGKEWIVNQAQQLKLANLLGTSRDKLKGALGFTGGPTSFAGGGEPVPFYAQQRRANEEEKYEARISLLKRRNRDDEVKAEERLHKKRLAHIKEYEQREAERAKRMTAEQLRQRNISAGLYRLPTLMPDTVGRIGTETDRAFRATSRDSFGRASRPLRSRPVNAYMRSLNALIGDDGLFDQFQTVMDRTIDVWATSLKRATYKIAGKGHGRQVEKVKSDADTAAKEIDQMNDHFTMLGDQYDDLSRAMHSINARIRRVTRRTTQVNHKLRTVGNQIANIRRGGVDDDEEARLKRLQADQTRLLHERKGLTATDQNLVAARRKVQQRLRDNAKAQAEALEQIFTAQLDAFTKSTDEGLKKIEERMPGGGGIPLSVLDSVASAIGRTSDIRKIQAQQLQNYKDQVPMLESAIAEADSKGYTEYAAQLRGQLSDVWGKIQTGTEEALKNAIEDINSIAAEANRRTDLKGRLADVVGLGGSAVRALTGGLSGPEAAARMRESLNRDRGATLTTQRDALLGQIGGRGEYNRMLNMPLDQLTDVQKTLIEQIGDLDDSVIENTAQQGELATATRQATIDAINSRAQFGTGVTGSLADIINKVGQVSGTVDTAALKSVTEQTGKFLADQFSGLAGQFKSITGTTLSSDPMTIVGQMQTVLNNWGTITANMSESQKSQLQDLVNTILGNTSATLDNNDQLKQVSGAMTAFNFSTTAWTRFRSAVFTGMGTVLPQYPVPHLQTGGFVTKSGLFDLHAGEHVINPNGGTHQMPTQEGDINITVNEAGKPVDTLGLAKRVAWERGSRR